MHLKQLVGDARYSLDHFIKVVADKTHNHGSSFRPLALSLIPFASSGQPKNPGPSAANLITPFYPLICDGLL